MKAPQMKGFVLQSTGIKNLGGMSPEEVKIRSLHLGLYSGDSIIRLELENDDIQLLLY